MHSLLSTLERYYDAVPRTSARTETLGSFTLFVSREASWPFYARPALGTTDVSEDDVRRVRERQRALHIPEAFEWVAETSPGAKAPIEAAGVEVHQHPLMVLDRSAHRQIGAPAGVALRLVRPDEDDLPLLRAVASIGFGAPGTAIDPVGPTEVAIAAAQQAPGSVAFARDRLRAGLTYMAVAFVDGQPVAVGSHQPLDSVSEIVGVATLASHRRRGIGAALTSLLVEDAFSRGVETIFLSAGDDAVARIYGQTGFERIGTACIGEAPA
jgi:ribosomal protein S18 acetylase RimI-like enzyme